MIILTQRLPPDHQFKANAVLPLTAEERTRSRYRYCFPKEDIVERYDQSFVDNLLRIFEADATEHHIYLQLPRGTYLQHGDFLRSDTGEILIRVVARPEAVMTVSADTPLKLLQAAYHLGNRHVPLEVAEDYLRLSPDPVLKSMLEEQLQVHVLEEIQPFYPESGAYHPH
ncbi:MAG: urease accessory protein UreE [Microcoleaceae cyanobacterium]